jgi:hypothetical protein
VTDGTFASQISAGQFAPRHQHEARLMLPTGKNHSKKRRTDRKWHFGKHKKRDKSSPGLGSRSYWPQLQSLRIETEFTLASIDNDLFSASRFCGAKRRWAIFSKPLTNSPVPNGRPVYVHWRMAGSLDSIPPAARYSCQVETVQRLCQTSRVKQLSAALVPQCVAARPGPGLRLRDQPGSHWIESA